MLVLLLRLQGKTGVSGKSQEKGAVELNNRKTKVLMVTTRLSVPLFPVV